MLLSLLLAYLAGNVTAGALTGQMLERRGPQTSAFCSADFDWADSSQGLSPCLLAAVVIGACQGGSWHVPALNATTVYPNPNSTTANVCTCSWLAYNLLAACADCQGFMQSVPNVALYFQSCQGFVTTTSSYFPANYSLPEGIFIPYWATTDPNAWPSQHFDMATAMHICHQGHPDIYKAIAFSPKKKTPISHIIGGVIGGLAFLLLASGTFIYRKHTTRQLASPSLIMEHLAYIPTSPDMTRASLNSVTYSALPEEYVIEPFTSRPVNIPLEGRKNAIESIPVNDTATIPLLSILSRELQRPPSSPPTYSDANHSPSSPPRDLRPNMYQKHTFSIQNGSGLANESSASLIGESDAATIPEIPAPAGRYFVGVPNRDANLPRSQGNASSVDPRDIA